MRGGQEPPQLSWGHVGELCGAAEAGRGERKGIPGAVGTGNITGWDADTGGGLREAHGSSSPVHAVQVQGPGGS